MTKSNTSQYWCDLLGLKNQEVKWEVWCQFIVTRSIEHSNLDSPRTLRVLPTYRGRSCNKVGGTNFSGSALGTIFTCAPKGKAWH